MAEGLGMARASGEMADRNADYLQLLFMPMLYLVVGVGKGVDKNQQLMRGI
jgi:hypothetical protein